MHRINFFLFRFFVFPLSWLPLWMLYGLSPIIYFLLRYVLQYRKKVIIANLQLAFPDRSRGDRESIRRKNYRHLSRLAVEVLKSYHISQKTIRERMPFNSMDILEEYFQNEKSLIVALGHIGNWEWASLSAALTMPHRTMSVFLPGRNEQFDTWINHARSRYGMELVSAKQVLRTLITAREVPTVIYFLADQSPSNLEAAHWVDFFQQPTPFIGGMEKVARATNRPVLFAGIRTRGKGRYEIYHEIICEEPDKLPEGEITMRYAQCLEKLIREYPETWLWSHRRWKHAHKAP